MKHSVKIVLFVIAIIIVVPEIIPIGLIWWLCRCIKLGWQSCYSVLSVSVSDES